MFTVASAQPTVSRHISSNTSQLSALDACMTLTTWHAQCSELWVQSNLLCHVFACACLAGTWTFKSSETIFTMCKSPWSLHLLFHRSQCIKKFLKTRCSKQATILCSHSVQMSRKSPCTTSIWLKHPPRHHQPLLFHQHHHHPRARWKI